MTQYRYPHTSRSISDIVKYLTNDRGVKFTGYYVSPKKFDDGRADIGEVDHELNDEQDDSPYSVTLNSDPLYRYKPKHPADVNLLATSNLR